MRDTIQDEYNKVMAEEIRAEIDWEILKDIYKKVGYTEVEFYPIRNGVEAVLISEWIKSNVTGYVKSHGNCIMFEKADEALMFKLRWGT